MDKVAEIWASIKQLITSRTIWGGLILLLNAVGVDLNPDIGGAVVNVGDQLVNAIGAILVLIGYTDRRPKPGTVSVRAPS